MKIKFGATAPVDVKEVKSAAKKFAAKRKNIVEPGIENNAHSKYSYEVNFTNIRPVVNITRTKTENVAVSGIAKGAILDNVPISVPTNDAAATMHAMKKRCDHSPHLVNIDDFKLGHSLVMAKFAPQPEILMDSELFDKYLSRCKGGKAERLLSALGEHQLNTEMGTKHVFAKQEVLLKEWGSQPRVVYQGTDMYNALTGPVVMVINDRMKQNFSLDNPLNKGNTIIYACGASGEDLGKVMDQASGTAIESDAKNNDGSQSAEFRKYEAMFYRKMGAPVWFVREFANNVSVRVWTRYGVAATVDGQRWSGETTTTTGNSYVHMCLNQAALAKAQVERSTNIHGGDDYLGFVEGDVAKVEGAIKETFVASGMVAEVVPQKTRHHATFYRKRYVRSTSGTLPVPQFGRVLSKLNIRANRNTAVNDRDYMAGKYLSAAYEHRHVPGISEMLIATSERLSDKPFIDVRQSKAEEMGGVEGVKRIVESAKIIPVDEFEEFLDEVYGVSYSGLADAYCRVAESCVQYCDGWTFVEKRGGKVVNRKNNSDYRPPIMTGDVIDSLTRLDT